MTTERRELLDRVRALLGAGEVREVSMFGAVALMVDDAMAVAVQKDGGLLVRVAPAEDGSLLAEPDATRAEMGRGRAMGTGWIRVTADGKGLSDERLAFWVTAALRR